MENIALRKPIHASSGKETAHFVTEPGQEAWEAELYPAYVDIDLEENYNLCELRVYTSKEGFTQYALYTSINGRDFDRVVNKMEKDPCPDEGDVFRIEKEARFVRVLIKYVSAGSKAKLLYLEALGEKSGTPLQIPEAVAVSDFQGSRYDRAPTKEDTVAALEGIVRRNLGEEYVDWFRFELQKDDKLHHFTVENEGERIKISGNAGVSLACGLNFYLKEVCHVLIAQVGSGRDMPPAPPKVEAPIHKATPFSLRYAYNYCTHSYTMAFWGEREWQRELDWLALNGVTIVLDIVGQEEVWRRFLTALGYAHQEIKDFIVGPAYGAWAYMANMYGFGGPVHDSWFERRTELARKNHFFMRSMGMQPVLQGYSGMVPRDIREKDPTARVIPQGLWNGFQRPDMLKTDTQTYARYAALYYKAQRDVFGDISRYFATDPFHEGGSRAGLSTTRVSRHIIAALLRENKENVWVIQCWGENPSAGLLWGLRGHKENALVLDLYAEKRPRWQHFRGREFGHTPWVYCMLNNFGGRMGLHGHMDTLVREIPRAQQKAKKMRGVGISPEATQSNPVLFDLLFETIWGEEGAPLIPIDLSTWLPGYALRRFGGRSAAAEQALELMHQTVYNPECNETGEGAPESVVNARPALAIRSASTWGNGVIGYEKKTLEEVLRLLLTDYEKLKDSPGYRYDVADCMKQVLSNTAQEYHKRMAEAFEKGDRAAFERWSDQFLDVIDMADRVQGTQREFLLGSWLKKAAALAEGTDDFTKELFRFNAKALITTWGSRVQADGGLKDYSNRQWAGLSKGYYKPRWQLWVQNAKAKLLGEKREDEDWFPMEWQWVWGEQEEPSTPSGEDLNELGQEVLRRFSVLSL